MPQRILLAALSFLLLAGCGRGSEDFAIKVDRPPSRVNVALDRISIDQEIGMVMSGLRIKRSEPEPGQILYTIPGDGDFEATILFTLEPSKDGKATVVHAAIDVPAVKLSFGGKEMYLSEPRVERALKKILQNMRNSLEDGGSVEHARKEISQLLTVLAVVTDSKQMRLAQDLKNNPERLLEALAGLDDSGISDADYPDQAYGDLASGQDPGAAARRAEYRAEEAAREASEPMDAAEGDSAQGDYAGGDDPGGSYY